MPGGMRAINDWRAEAYSRRQSYMAMNETLRATEQAAVAAMSPAEEWDWMARQFGEGIIERQWGPRPAE
jgi:hypothetical protein